MDRVKRVREISRIKSISNFSNRKIENMLGFSHQTIGRDLHLLKAQQLDYVEICALDDEELTQRLFPDAPFAKSKWRLPDFDQWVGELPKKNQTIRNLWYHYYFENPDDAYELSTIYQKFEAHCKLNNLEALLEHRPGEEAQFDYCGTQISLTLLGATDKEVFSIFVGVLCHSKYFLACATPRQTSNDWVEGSKAFFEYIGGVPKIGIPDNPKAIATKPRPNLQLNPIYKAFVDHYGFVAMPARPGEPRDKGIVESTVKFVSERILVDIEKKSFRNLEELNTYLRKECDKLNAQPFQKRSTSRLELFESAEKPILDPLPEKPFKHIERAYSCTVPSHYRVTVDEHRYSVPWRWANRSADVVVTKDEVSITHASKKPVVHKRSLEKGGETIIKSHLHPKHEAMVLLPKSEFLSWAEEYGDNTLQFIEKIHEGKPDGDIRANQACKSVQSTARKYASFEVEAAIGFCLHFKQYTPTALKHALASKVYLDDGFAPPVVGMHENVRGAQHYEWLGRH